MLRTSDFDYNLREELIAQNPVAGRDCSRLLVLHRKNAKIEHRIFKNVDEYLGPDDLLVLNNTKVIPARLIGYKETGGKIKVLLLSKIKDDIWEVLVDRGHGIKVGKTLEFGKELKAQIIEEPKEGGIAKLRFYYNGEFFKVLESLGEIPLPPYIKNFKFQIPNLKQRYQTVYAKVEGATAAPTAGFHFTKSLLNKMKTKGINIAYITLHTGYATFKPVTAEYVQNHKMYKEYYIIPNETVAAIKSAKRVIAVGTTTVRALETMALRGEIKSQNGETDLFIYPPYKFKIVDALITNFHFPRSTLLMLVSAFGGHQFVMKAYQEAIKEKYRFYSFGDAMLIL